MKLLKIEKQKARKLKSHLFVMKQFFTVTNNRIYAYCTQLGEKVMWDKEVRVMGRRKVRMILGRKEKRDVGMGICRTHLKGPNGRNEGENERRRVT